MFMALGALVGAAATGFGTGALAAASIGAGIGGAIDGGQRSAAAARAQAEATNDAAERQYYYDTAAWQARKERLVADRDFAIEELLQKSANEQKLAQHKDALSAQRYLYDVQIRDREQASLDAQYERSDEVYNAQLYYNSLAERAGIHDELIRLEETQIESRIDDEELRLKALMDEGEIRSRGLSGLTADKAVYSVWNKAGKRIRALNDTLQSAGRTSRAVINEIKRDKETADLAAYAAKMLDPGILPEVIEPIATPLTDWIMPRALEEYDFGPAPVLGATADPSAAAGRAWGTTLTSIAGSVPTYYAMGDKAGLWGN